MSELVVVVADIDVAERIAHYHRAVKDEAGNLRPACGARGGSGGRTLVDPLGQAELYAEPCVRCFGSERQRP